MWIYICSYRNFFHLLLNNLDVPSVRDWLWEMVWGHNQVLTSVLGLLTASESLDRVFQVCFLRLEVQGHLSVHSDFSFVFEEEAEVLKQWQIATRDCTIQYHDSASFDYFWLCLRKGLYLSILSLSWLFLQRSYHVHLKSLECLVYTVVFSSASNFRYSYYLGE